MSRYQCSVDAAKKAGYTSKGSDKTFAANARKRANTKSIKDKVAELQKPAKEKLAQAIERNVQWAADKLQAVIDVPVGTWNTRAADRIKAIEAMARLLGWISPAKQQNLINQPVKFNVTYTRESESADDRAELQGAETVRALPRS